MLKDPNYKPSDAPTQSSWDAMSREVVGVIEFAEKTPIPDGFMTCDELKVQVETLRTILKGASSYLSYSELQEAVR